MKINNDLKSIVLGILMENKQSSVKTVLNLVNLQTNKKYAYTTIATVLTRLESENLVKSEVLKNGKRKIKLYNVVENAPKNEVNLFIKRLYRRFGMVGVRNLGEALDTRLDDEDLEAIRQKLGLE